MQFVCAVVLFGLCASHAFAASTKSIPVTSKKPEINRPVAKDGPFFPPDPYECDGPDDTDCDCG